ncbi:hypothetical protein [Thalassomonas haliotis]|uniref:Uncharacterized protein n=1 Tax=Thalassomonas haliotis TaxID=485448 RepID=A0ABY7VAW7_9GAMM|nr:hypothetical protein [Thalassomonas haliotis]WDE10773.1 hypothetical protein H3N35_21385 [Thalassomonas haliotis]
MKMISLFIITAAINLLAISPAEAQEHNLPVYSCDTCSAAKAITVAKQHSNPLECHWNNPPGTTPQPGDQYCETTYKLLAVANPLTRESWKFKVTTSSNNIYEKLITVEQINFLEQESELISSFFNIDHEFREAVTDAATTIMSNKKNNILSSSEDCSSHPASYFTSQGKQKIEDQMTAQITRELNGNSWFDHITEKTWTGGSFSLGKDNVSIGVQFDKDERPVFTHAIFGDPLDNILAFKVGYSGEYLYSSHKRLALSYELQKGASRIEGFILSQLDNSHVDMRGMEFSQCFIAFFEDLLASDVEEMISRSAGGFPVSPTIGWGGMGGGGGLCTTTVHTRAGNRQQTFIFPVSC